MSCYLLFKEPMKYLVPRGSGRPTYSFSVRFGFVFYSFFRLGIEFCVNMTSNDNLHARLKSVPSLLDWVDLILKSVYRILPVLILGFYL